MTKAPTAAERRRKKKLQQLAREQEKQQQAEATAKPVKGRSPAERAAFDEAIEVRARKLGVWPPSVIRVPGEPDAAFRAREMARQQWAKALRDWVGNPIFADAAGRAVAGEDDSAILRETIQRLLAMGTAHRRAIDAPREISAMNLMVAPDDGENGDTVTSIAADFRTEEERAAAAVEAWKDVKRVFDLIAPKAFANVEAVILFDMPAEPESAPTLPAVITDWLKGATKAQLNLLRDLVPSMVADRTRAGAPSGFSLASVLRQYQLIREFQEANRRLPADLKEAKEWLRTRQTGEAA